MTEDDTFTLRRLAWAGVEIRLGDTRLVIDAIENVEPFAETLGPPREPMPPVDTPPGTHGLISHVHPDHYDPTVLTRIAASTGTVGCFTTAAGQLADAGLAPVSQEIDEPRRIGPLTVTPVPSMDWRGDDQVAWIVEGGGRRVIHCGDTQWHGYWWRIGRAHGPFDVAFMPVNGVVARFEEQEAAVPVTMTPEQAVEAAHALGASTICPIHYELFHNPPSYVEQAAIKPRVLVAADDRGMRVVLAKTGQGVPV